MSIRRIRDVMLVILSLTLVCLCADAQGLRRRMRTTGSGSDFPAKGSLVTARKITITVDGVSRYYLLQPVARPGVHPVVVLLHGGTEDAEQAWRQTSLPTLGQQEGFIVVAPNALNKHWNDGRGAVLGGKPSTADDVGFLRQVISEVITQHHGDPRAVFMTGPSNGGFMTMHFACHAGTILRAAANVISDLPDAELANCSAPALPWLSMNGTADPIVPFEGMKAGTIKNGQPQPALLSADATFRFWAERSHCGPFVSDERLPHLNPRDPTSAERRVCMGRNGIESIQYIFHGGGHTWPNARYGALLRRIIGDSNQDVDAGQALWEFFKSTYRPGGRVPESVGRR